jgi:omega-hydroxy-beta-dihydromenaquinone-9 sulfotransferase
MNWTAKGRSSVSSGPALLAGGPELAEWVIAGRTAPQAPRLWRFRLRWAAYWYKKLQTQQRRRMPASRPTRAPLLVLGLWRSGTTLLHERLADLPGMQSPQTWQCFNPSTFMLTSAPRGHRQRLRRPMDEGEVGPQTPQEDEFALLLQGAPSLYRAFIDPRRLDDLARQHFDVSQERVHSALERPWPADWLHFLAGVEAQGEGRRLVLKSPNHCFRLAELNELFQDSPQVWIGRPLAAVWWSNLRMWQAMFEQYALWPCPPGALERFLGRCIQAYAKALDQALQRREASRTAWVDFDDLASQPLGLLKVLAQFAGVAAADAPSEMLQALLKRHVARSPITPNLPLPEWLHPLQGQVEELHARARRLWGWRSMH